MYIIFDATTFNFLRFTLITQDQEMQIVVEEKNRELLAEFEKFLIEHNKKLEDITGIAVILGEGSFTSTRIAVTVANTLALTKGILVSGINKQTTYNFSKLEKLFSTIKPKSYIHATYSGKPNIN